jgi:hypothetical protein
MLLKAEKATLRVAFSAFTANTDQTHQTMVTKEVINGCKAYPVRIYGD